MPTCFWYFWQSTEQPSSFWPSNYPKLMAELSRRTRGPCDSERIRKLWRKLSLKKTRAEKCSCEKIISARNHIEELWPLFKIIANVLNKISHLWRDKKELIKFNLIGLETLTIFVTVFNHRKVMFYLNILWISFKIHVN